MDMSTPLLLEVAPEIDTNPTSFTGVTSRGGVGPVKVRSSDLTRQSVPYAPRSPCLSTLHILSWRRPWSQTDPHDVLRRASYLTRWGLTLSMIDGRGAWHALAKFCVQRLG